MRVLLLVSSILVASSYCWSVILVNVYAGGSHQTVSLYTANLLAERGHKVTYVTTNVPKKLHPDITKVRLEENERLGNAVLEAAVELDADVNATVWEKLQMGKTLLNLCPSFYSDPGVQDLMRTAPKFDAMITFGFLYEGCAFGLAYKLGIPAKLLHMPASAMFPQHISNMGFPLYKSSVNHDGMLFRDPDMAKNSMSVKVRNLVQSWVGSVVLDLMQRFFIEPAIYENVEGYPGYYAMLREVRLVLMHHHPVVDIPIPFGPGVVGLAGTICKNYNPDDFSVELKDFIGSDKGFIYISFGSHIKTLCAEEQQILIGAFSKLPYNVVWKFGTKLENLPPNIKTFSWLPQMSLLQHPKIKGFISHGGYASKAEAFCAGVPMLIIPRFATDQHQHALQIQSRGLGDAIIELKKATSEEVYQKIVTITSEEVLANMRVVQRQLRSTRVTDDQLLGYIDMAISGQRLLPGYQPWWEYFYLDMILVPVIAILVIKYIVRKIRG